MTQIAKCLHRLPGNQKSPVVILFMAWQEHAQEKAFTLGVAAILDELIKPIL